MRLNKADQLEKPYIDGNEIKKTANFGYFEFVATGMVYWKMEPLGYIIDENLF